MRVIGRFPSCRDPAYHSKLSYSTSSCSAALIRISGFPFVHLDSASDFDLLALDAGEYRRL